MINNEQHPVAWAMFVYDLVDAREHLTKLVEEMVANKQIDEMDFRIQLGHVYSHLNRAWNGRNTAEEIDTERWQAQRQFPIDLDPV